MSSETFYAERDVLGIVTQRRQDRARFARFVQYRVRRPTPLPVGFRELVERVVDEKLSQLYTPMPTIQAPPKPVVVLPVERPPGQSLSVEAIIALVASATGYTAEDLVGPLRPKRLARARQMLYGLLRALRPSMSFPVIGRAVGGRDHSSALHGLRRFDELRYTEPLASWMLHPAVVKLLAKE